MIYFIQSENGGPIKIGYSKNFDDRLKTLQEGNPYKLIVLGLMEGTIPAEQRLHRKFEEHRFRNEWFNDCQEIRDFISNCQSFDYRTLFMEPKKIRKSNGFDYSEFEKRLEAIIQIKRLSVEESVETGYQLMKKELHEFGHSLRTANKIATRSKIPIEKMARNAFDRNTIPLPIDHEEYN